MKEAAEEMKKDNASEQANRLSKEEKQEGDLDESLDETFLLAMQSHNTDPL